MGEFRTRDGLTLHYEEYGTGDRVILSAMAGLFYPNGLQQALARRGYHVYCMTLRGFFLPPLSRKIMAPDGTTDLRKM